MPLEVIVVTADEKSFAPSNSFVFTPTAAVVSPSPKAVVSNAGASTALAALMVVTALIVVTKDEPSIDDTDVAAAAAAFATASHSPLSPPPFSTTLAG